MSSDVFIMYAVLGMMIGMAIACVVRYIRG
jgi:hypothetical protein